MPDYHEYTHGDRFAIKRWLHRKRFVDTLTLLKLGPRDTLLDYGCGDGYFLEQCLHYLPAQQLVGYDPMPTMAQQARERVSVQNILVHQQLAELGEKKFSTIVCLETCEHLVDRDRLELYNQITKLMGSDGRVVFTVPVEIGPVALVKNLYRLLRREKYENISIATVFTSFFGWPTRRQVNLALGAPYVFSHVGFDYRKFEDELRQYFTISRKMKTPFTWLPAWLNITVGYVCELKPN